MEVQRARNKPVDELDVRDLSYRAYVDWGDKKQRKDEKGAYVTATGLLNRALALAPDDPLALFLTASVNLCDCVDGVVEERRGAAGHRLGGAGEVSSARSRVAADAEPEGRIACAARAVRGVAADRRFDAEARSGECRRPRNKAYDLLKLGQPQEALDGVNEVLDRPDWMTGNRVGGGHSLRARAVRTRGADGAKGADADEPRRSEQSPKSGAVGLTLVAAEARLGHVARAKAALADFNAAVPGVKTISAMKKWMHPAADLAGYEPLFDGLRLAGVPD